MPELHRVAQFLFEHEKMSGEQFICAVEDRPIPVEEAEEELESIDEADRITETEDTAEDVVTDEAESSEE